MRTSLPLLLSCIASAVAGQEEAQVPLTGDTELSAPDDCHNAVSRFSNILSRIWAMVLADPFLPLNHLSTAYILVVHLPSSEPRPRKGLLLTPQPPSNRFPLQLLRPPTTRTRPVVRHPSYQHRRRLSGCKDHYSV